jgi:hypothetical protein
MGVEFSVKTVRAAIAFHSVITAGFDEVSGSALLGAAPGQAAEQTLLASESSVPPGPSHGELARRYAAIVVGE